MTYRARDAARNESGPRQTFTITVAPPIAPTLARVGDQVFSLNTAITPLELSAAVGGTGTLTYTLACLSD